jgi:hypothetical protein
VPFVEVNVENDQAASGKTSKEVSVIDGKI